MAKNKILASLFRAICDDQRITTIHFGLFTAIALCWERNGFQYPFNISRRELMAICKICSTRTYHKCIKQLHEFEYINYFPSYHPVFGSTIYWHKNFEGKSKKLFIMDFNF
ncbi:hypothetical protein [Pedobacter psychrodurus]|uniref:hypothetical protein n=1 Tax=Pedobacter psychrodurus TaxID=2530456 RepID=UPI00292FF4DE|nr:hypothetical protein [Pedobacter psychrodurus]